jgi:hypothetical protein
VTNLHKIWFSHPCHATIVHQICMGRCQFNRYYTNPISRYCSPDLALVLAEIASDVHVWDESVRTAEEPVSNQVCCFQGKDIFSNESVCVPISKEFLSEFLFSDGNGVWDSTLSVDERVLGNSLTKVDVQSQRLSGHRSLSDSPRHYHDSRPRIDDLCLHARSDRGSITSELLVGPMKRNRTDRSHVCNLF